MSLNIIIVQGRLTRDPEYKVTGSGLGLVNFTVACDRDFSGGNGKDKETDFIDCTAWRKTAEFITKYFQKGSMILVTGSLNINKWTDKDGNKRNSAYINVQNAYFGETKRSQEQAAAPAVPAGGFGAGPAGNFSYPFPGGAPGGDYAVIPDDGEKMPWD